MPFARSVAAALTIATLVGCESATTLTVPERGLTPRAPNRTIVSTPAVDPASNHYYQVVRVTGGTNWFNADAAASAQSIAGCTSAHLASITSAEEGAFIGSLGDEGGWWVAGRKYGWTPSTTDGWTWTTGENWTYANWRGGEPNNSPSNAYGALFEDAIYVNLGTSGALFVDYPAGGSDLDGYVVEFEGCTPPTPQGQTQAVITTVSSLVSSGALSASDAGPITTSLSQAVTSLTNGKTSAAKGQLGAAVNKTNALVHSGRLSAAQAKAITDPITAILNTL
ncbi:MAG: hypothetical protein JWM41_3055 [Gemmatimonadetes bacterium]|nr:hypothetical protein [Gemmatimonadota bacterium]